jgi:hypothetical protein
MAAHAPKQESHTHQNDPRRHPDLHGDQSQPTSMVAEIIHKDLQVLSVVRIGGRSWRTMFGCLGQSPMATGTGWIRGDRPQVDGSRTSAVLALAPVNGSQ